MAPNIKHNFRIQTLPEVVEGKNGETKLNDLMLAKQEIEIYLCTGCPTNHEQLKDGLKIVFNL